MKSLSQIIVFIIITSITAWGQTFSLQKPIINYPNVSQNLFFFDNNFNPENFEANEIKFTLNSNEHQLDSILFQNSQITDSLELLICFEYTSAIDFDNKILYTEFINYIKNLTTKRYISFTILFFNENQIIVLDKYSIENFDFNKIYSTTHYLKPNINNLSHSDIFLTFLKSKLKKSIILFGKSTPRIDIQDFSNLLISNKITFTNVNLNNLEIEKYEELSILTESNNTRIDDFDTQDNLFRSLLFLSFGGKPIKFYWKFPFESKNYLISSFYKQSKSSINQYIYEKEIPTLELQSNSVYFGTIDSGFSKLANFRIFARNKDITITEIIVQPDNFMILDFTKEIKIKKDNFFDFRINYNSIQTEFTTGEVKIKTSNNNVYTIYLYAGKKPQTPIADIEILSPFSTKIIKEYEVNLLNWKNTFPADTFKIDYKSSTDTLWNNITNFAVNNEYNWQTHKIINDFIDIKVSQTSSNLVSKKVIQLIGHTKKITDIVWSPNDSLISTSSEDGRIFLWESKSGKLIKTLFQSQSKIISGIDWSNDSKYIAIAAYDTLIKIWNINNDFLQKELKSAFNVKKIKFTRDDNKIIGILENGDILIWNFETGLVEHNFSSGSINLTKLLLNPAYDYFATASEDGKVIIWDYSTGKKINEFSSSPYPVFGFSFSPSGNNLAISTSDSKVRIYDIFSGNNVLTLFDVDSPIFDVNWMNNKLYILSSQKNNIKLWTPSDGSLINTYDQHNSNVYSITSNHQGNFVSSIEENNIVHIWSPFNFPFERPELFSSIIKDIEVVHKNIISQDLILPIVQKNDTIFYFDNNFATNSGNYPALIDTCFLQSNLKNITLTNSPSNFYLSSNKNITGEIEYSPEDSLLLSTTGIIKSSSKIIRKNISGFSPERFFDKKVNEINFGTIPLGDSKDTTIFILQNISKSGFIIDSIEVISGFTQSFIITKPSIPYTMQPLGGAFVPNINFVPKKNGLNTAFMRIYFKNSIPVDIYLKGIAVAPLLKIDTSINYGTFLCESNVIKEIKVKNNGNADLNIYDFEVFGLNKDELKIEFVKNQLSPSEETSLLIYLNPKKIGSSEFLVRVRTNFQANFLDYSNFKILYNKDSINYIIDSSKISFYPKSDVDKIQKKLSILNTGNIFPILDFSYIPKYFKIDSTSSQTSQTIIYISFLGGLNSEYYLDSLMIIDKCNNNYKIILEAILDNTNPILSTDSKIDFRTQNCAKIYEQKIKIKNNGNSNLEIYTVSLKNKLNVFIFDDAKNLTIVPGENILLPIQFAPTVDGIYNDTLVIESNAVNSENGINKILISGSLINLKYEFSDTLIVQNDIKINITDTFQIKFYNNSIQPIESNFYNINPQFQYEFSNLSEINSNDSVVINVLFRSPLTGIFEDFLFYKDVCGISKFAQFVYNVKDKNDNFFEVGYVYPNPSIDKFFLNIKSNQKYNYNYRLIDYLGKMIFESNVMQNQNVNEILEISINNLSIGVYILELNTSNGKFIRKIIKLE